MTLSRTTLPTFPLATHGLGGALRARGLITFDNACSFVRALPYGRVALDDWAMAVLTEERGTCSSKHLLLAQSAHEAGHDDVQLMMGLYLMREANTPGVGEVLRAAGLVEIPEVHCYLTVNGVWVDCTGLPAGEEAVLAALIEERPVAPKLLAPAKPLWHRERLNAWAMGRGLDPEWAWSVREKCIAALAMRRSTDFT